MRTTATAPPVPPSIHYLRAPNYQFNVAIIVFLVFVGVVLVLFTVMKVRACLLPTTSEVQLGIEAESNLKATGIDREKIESAGEVILFIIGSDIAQSNNVGSEAKDLIKETTQPMAREENKNLQEQDCAVCLTEFSHGEYIKLLHSCKHLFHKVLLPFTFCHYSLRFSDLLNSSQDCIDAWLVHNVTCPVCRSSLQTEEL